MFDATVTHPKLAYSQMIVSRNQVRSWNQTMPACSAGCWLCTAYDLHICL